MAVAGAGPAFEFTRTVPADRVGGVALAQSITATEAERAAIAVRLNIPEVLALACHYRLARASDTGRAGEIVAAGVLSARLVRICVVTLDPFEESIDHSFQVRFVPEGSESDDPDPDRDDEIPYAGTQLDLGEAAVEELALVLDPYPHKPGAALPDAATDPASATFAELLRRR